MPTSSSAAFCSTSCLPASTRFATTACGLPPTASGCAAFRTSLPKANRTGPHKKHSNHPHPNLNGGHSPLKVNHVPIVAKVFWCGVQPSLGHRGHRPDSSRLPVLVPSGADGAAPSLRFLVALPVRPPRRPGLPTACGISSSPRSRGGSPTQHHANEPPPEPVAHPITACRGTRLHPTRGRPSR
jgi:hypothetical protein